MARKLLDEVSAVARLKHLSIKTEKIYRHHIKKFILFHQKRHPREMAEAEVREYLSDLAVNRHVAASTQNLAHVSKTSNVLTEIEEPAGMKSGGVCASKG